MSTRRESKPLLPYDLAQQVSEAFNDYSDDLDDFDDDFDEDFEEELEDEWGVPLAEAERARAKAEEEWARRL